jgi:hypothetical protein
MGVEPKGAEPTTLQGSPLSGRRNANKLQRLAIQPQAFKAIKHRQAQDNSRIMIIK